MTKDDVFKLVIIVVFIAITLSISALIWISVERNAQSNITKSHKCSILANTAAIDKLKDEMAPIMRSIDNPLSFTAPIPADEYDIDANVNTAYNLIPTTLMSTQEDTEHVMGAYDMVAWVDVLYDVPVDVETGLVDTSSPGEFITSKITTIYPNIPNTIIMPIYRHTFVKDHKYFIGIKSPSQSMLLRVVSGSVTMGSTLT